MEIPNDIKGRKAAAAAHSMEKFKNEWVEIVCRGGGASIVAGFFYGFVLSINSTWKLE